MRLSGCLTQNTAEKRWIDALEREDFDHIDAVITMVAVVITLIVSTLLALRWSRVLRSRLKHQIAAGKRKNLEFVRLFEESNDALAIHTIGGQIVRVNRRMCELTGYARQELGSMSLRQINTFLLGAETASCGNRRIGQAGGGSGFIFGEAKTHNVDMCAI